MILVGQFINNDALMYGLMLVALIGVLAWDKNPSIGNTVLMATAMGLAMMTKLNAVIIAPILGFFLLKKIVRPKEISQKTALGRFFLFLAICAPLGLWFFGFTAAHGYLPVVPSPGDTLYTGNRSIWDWFLSIPAEQWDWLPFVPGSPETDYNIPIEILKTSIFGEFKYPNASMLGAYLLIFLNIVLMVLSLFGMVRNIMRKKFLLSVLWLLAFGSYIGFNLSDPYWCTSNFRYLIIALITGAGFIGSLAEDSQDPEGNGTMELLSIVGSVTFCFVAIWFSLTQMTS
jgi:4-amino-4-deoxy-L-arabinose transferase-like glycosyltransferase